MRSTYGWAEISEQRKREIVESIADGTVTLGLNVAGTAVRKQ